MRGDQSATFQSKIDDLEKQITELRQTQVNNTHHANNAVTENDAKHPPKNGKGIPSQQEGGTNSTNTIDTTEILDYISTTM